MPPRPPLLAAALLLAAILLSGCGNTARALMPMTHTFVLRSSGNSYIETTDRDNSLWVKGIDVKQYEYYYEDAGGWIDPGESNKIEGFFLYEVPVDVTPQNSHISVIFTGKADAVWKLG